MALYRANTELEAANLALGTIGEPPIGSFQDNSSRARVLSRFFGTKRDEILRGHDWNFCGAHFIPAMNPIPALGHLKNRFAMPDDCLKVRDVRPYKPNVVNTPNQITITDPNIIAELESLTSQPLGMREWGLENPSVGNEPPIGPIVVVTNMTQPIVNYTRRVTIIRLWDAQALSSFIEELAGAIAPEIAKDINAGEKLKASSRETVDHAARTDSREQSPRHVSRETSWVRSRFIGAGYRGRWWR